MAGVICVYCLSLPADRCVYGGTTEERRRVIYQHWIEATTYSALEATIVENAIADEDTFIANAYVGMQTEEDSLGLSSIPTMTHVDYEPTVMTDTNTKSSGNEFPWLIILCVAGGVFFLCLIALVLMRNKQQRAQARTSRILMELESPRISGEAQTPEGEGQTTMGGVRA